MAKKITPSNVSYNTMLTDMFERFPELKAPIEKQVNKIKKNKAYTRILVEPSYAVRDQFPKTMSVRVECFVDKKVDYTFSMSFRSAWKEY